MLLSTRHLAAGAALVLAGSLSAQAVSEIPAMTVPHSVIDMDSFPPGGTSTAALNAAGSNGGATMAAITVSPKTTSQPGVYNTAVCGYALAAGSGSGGILLDIIDDVGNSPFDAMTISIDLGAPSTEIGIHIADFMGPGLIDFYSGGALVTTFTSSSYGVCTELFYQMTGGTFDRVDIDVSSAAGNFVVPQLSLEQASGGPRLTITNLVAGSAATASVSNATPGGQVGIGYSLAGGGPTSANVGPCGTVTVELSNPITILPLLTANGSGVAATTANIPASTTGLGVWAQGLDIGSCTLTNGVNMVIG